MTSLAVRREAWRLLEGESVILDVAREVTALLRAAEIRGAIIGGLAVGLYGHVRATMDVDLWTAESLDRVAATLRVGGFSWYAAKREFRRSGVPVHIVTPAESGPLRNTVGNIDGIDVAALPDLVGMKLRSGLRSIVRAQDLADVIALIRVRKLTPTFAAKLDRELQAEFRKLVKAVRSSS